MSSESPRILVVGAGVNGSVCTAKLHRAAVLSCSSVVENTHTTEFPAWASSTTAAATHIVGEIPSST